MDGFNLHLLIVFDTYILYDVANLVAIWNVEKNTKFQLNICKNMPAWPTNDEVLIPTV